MWEQVYGIEHTSVKDCGRYTMYFRPKPIDEQKFIYTGSIIIAGCIKYTTSDLDKTVGIFIL